MKEHELDACANGAYNWSLEQDPDNLLGANKSFKASLQLHQSKLPTNYEPR